MTKKFLGILIVAALAWAVACDESNLVRVKREATCNGPRAASCEPRATSYTYNVINEYPHDPDAYTQGLIWVDTMLVEGTGWNAGPSTLRRVDLETGDVVQMRETPVPSFGEGVTQVGDRIVQLTWVKNIAFVYNAETFDSVNTFSYPTQGWGLTHDDARFIMSDGTDTLYYRDLDTFDEIGRVAVTDESGPVRQLNELEYINGEVWANIYTTDRIVMIDPRTGRVTGSLDLTGLEPPGSGGVLNGIAFDEETCRLFVTGKLWTRLFEITLVPEASSP
jgi:glutamine cyclotransferase